MGPGVLPQSDGPLIGRYGFAVALIAEARAFGRRPAAPGGLRPLPGGHWLGVSGMGPARARHMGLELAARGVRGLVSFGTCGGLAPGLAAGALICPRVVCGQQGTSYQASWPAGLGDFLPGLVSVDALLSISEPVCGVTHKADLFRRYGASGVDMESEALAQVACEQGLEFFALRAIVDPFDEPLPEGLAHAVDAWGRPRVGALLAALGVDGARWRALARLRQNFVAAQRSLALAAAALVGAAAHRPDQGV